MIKDLNMQLSDVTKILSEPNLSSSDVESLETELKEMNELVAHLSEEKLLKLSYVFFQLFLKNYKKECLNVD